MSTFIQDNLVVVQKGARGKATKPLLAVINLFLAESQFNIVVVLVFLAPGFVFVQSVGS